jgi:putative ABC transport system substrate-binding protein
VKRRKFIVGVVGAAVTWPLAAARAQQAMPVIGYLDAGSLASIGKLITKFRQGLAQAGYADGQNVKIEHRWGEGHHERLPMLAEELVRLQVALIVATGGEVSAVAAKAATATIPIVFDAGRDPVQLGLVASMNHPGGNATGVNQFNVELGGKSLGLLRQIAPNAKVIAFLRNPDNPGTLGQLKERQDAAQSMGLKIAPFEANSAEGIDAAFAAMANQRPGAVMIAADSFLFSQRNKISTLALLQALPAMHGRREFAEVGGLLSYGTSLAETYRQVGIYAGRILKGEKAADLPVVQSDKFELVLNLKTAKALRLAVPPDLLAIADDVIE